MRLSILNVAFPFAPVEPDPVGGAEKILAELDRALVAAGHRSMVIAAAGSRVHGELIPVALPPVNDATARRTVQYAVLARITEVIREESPDVVHLHGVDFAAYLPPPGPPVVVTLHLPPHLYPREALQPARPETYLVPVSAHQARALQGASLLEPIVNGVAIPPRAVHARRGFVLALGRICPEKCFHEALEAARRADCPMLLAGRVFGYAAHQQYFHEQIVPRLGPTRRWLGPIGGARKRRLLAAARAVLVPSRIEETSSLVAMEALAAGTPVIAYRAGALPDIVEHGVTGLLVEDVAEMAQAIRAARDIDPERCRSAACERFALSRMVAAYFAVYRRLAARAGAAELQRRVPKVAGASPSAPGAGLRPG